MGSYFFIVSKLNDFVMTVKDGDPEPGAHIVADRQLPEGKRRWHQLWELCVGHRRAKYHFIRSKLHDFAADLKEFSTSPGTRIIAFPQKCEDFDNQLWDLKFEDRGFFYLRSRLDEDMVIEIRDAVKNRRSGLVLGKRRRGAAHQLWKLVPCEDAKR